MIFDLRLHFLVDGVKVLKTNISSITLDILEIVQVHCSVEPVGIVCVLLICRYVGHNVFPFLFSHICDDFFESIKQVTSCYNVELSRYLSKTILDIQHFFTSTTAVCHRAFLAL